MLGLVYIEDCVAWTDEHSGILLGLVVALSDDELWADVLELEHREVVQLPTSILHPLD
jgi:hypothetical protein